MLSSLTQISTGSKMDTFVSDLRSKLSDHSRILTPANPDFAAASERWSDIDRKTPAVIVQPAGEEDIVVIVGEIRAVEWLMLSSMSFQVKAAHAAKIPFVPATGGHSPWSTIENGIIIDLSRFKDVRVDTDQQLVTVKGGVLMKELQIALSESNQFTSDIIGLSLMRSRSLIGCSCCKWKHCWCDTLHDRGRYQLLYAPDWVRLREHPFGKSRGGIRRRRCGLPNRE